MNLLPRTQFDQICDLLFSANENIIKIINKNSNNSKLIKMETDDIAKKVFNIYDSYPSEFKQFQ